LKQIIPRNEFVAEIRFPCFRSPVYRGYDIGAAFNEDYVDLMYRLERRDLGLYLFDVSNAPVREADGRLAVLENRWGRTEQLTLDESDTRWVATLEGAPPTRQPTTSRRQNHRSR
jgi:hypothetical protein